MSKERDIAYGLHSNIPRCCIDFFIGEWEYHYTHCTQYNLEVKRSAFNYVPCPDCFAKNNKVHLRICLTECGRECYKDF